jgi:E-phenylitaconyl-CoA hydratase
MELKYEKEGKVALLTLNRPEALNTLSPELFRQLHDAMEDFRADPDLWVGIITGTGEKAFCAGADIKTWLPFVKETKSKPWLFPSTTMRGMELWKPLIAAINGIAMGGGLELALACDLRIASEKARFASPEVRLGIMPRLGGTVRLPQAIPPAIAAEMMLTGKPINAQEAYRIGLVNKVVPQEQVMREAKEWADDLCKVGPLAARAIKESMIRGRGLSTEEALWLENTLALPLYETEDYVEGRAAFREKREPVFQAK